MITISLDEYGEFEKNDNKPLFIAGVIFDDQENAGEVQTEERVERERIRAYYKKAIEDAGEGFKYPQDLHSNDDQDRNHNVVSKVKEKVSGSLSEFIEKGTYKGKPLYNESGKKIRNRNGKYHLFVMLKSDDGKKRLLSENANMLANDDWAANRYFHMASSVVNRVVFHNPLYKQGCIPSINIDIATRSTGSVEKMNGDLVNEFKKQAYRVSENENSNHKFYSIMNADIYRTLIAQEMVNSGNVSVKIENLYVRSIQYEPSKHNMEFLYLSDSICSILGYKLNGKSADEWLEQIVNRAKALNPGNENLIFGYDEIDNYFAKAWNLFEQRNLYEALSIAYDAKIKKGKFAEWYRDIWFPYLEERIRESVTPELFSRSVNELSALLNINNLDQEKLLYLMQQFEAMVENVSDKYRSTDMKSVTMYKLYDAGVSAFCHIGNAKKALEYYDKCKQYAFYIGIDEYLKTNNKLIVCLEDAFEWERAIEIASENVSNQQLASEMKREILNCDVSANFLNEAKSISQLARIYAEMRDERAEGYFREALDKLEKGSANYKITQSYLLHYYADMGMKESFDSEALDYFDGRSTCNQCLRYIINSDEEVHSAFSNEYALYVLIRGLFWFHRDEINDSLWTKLCTLNEILTSNTGNGPSGHPWEITYKYLEMLAIFRNDDIARAKFSKLKHESLCYRGDTIYALEKFGDAEIADLEQNYKLRDSITMELSEFMKEKFETIKDIVFSDDGEERYNELQKYFTFMYR